MAIPAANQPDQRSYFNRCIGGIGRFMQRQSPIAQVLAGGASMLAFTAITRSVVQDAQNRFITAIAPFGIGMMATERFMGKQLTNIPFGIGMMATTPGIFNKISPELGIGLAVASGIAGVEITRQLPEPTRKSFITVAATISGLVGTSMLIGGGSLFAAGGYIALALTGCYLRSTAP